MSAPGTIALRLAVRGPACDSVAPEGVAGARALSLGVTGGEVLNFVGELSRELDESDTSDTRDTGVERATLDISLNIECMGFAGAAVSEAP